MKSFRNFISGLKKPKSEPFKGKRFPASQEANKWMSDRLAHELKHNPSDAHRLFSPASGDYMPQSVHVGSSWKPEHQKHYRDLKAQHPELVAKARELTRGIAGQVSKSTVGDPSDH